MSKSTLDVYHQQIVDNINESNLIISECETRINQINKEIDIIKEKGDSFIADNTNDYVNLLDERIELNDKINSIKRKINENSYYTDTADILYKYYDLIENGKGNISFNSFDKENSIMKYFNNDNNKTQVTQNTDRTRGNLLDDYMGFVDNYYYKNKNQQYEDKCNHCDSDQLILIAQDGYRYCSKCNTMDKLIVDHDKPSYKDPPKEITYFSYKRINHLNEWLNQIQGKETTEIPDEIYERILLEIKKQRITNMATLTNEKIKNILKQMKVHKYYEHIPHIMSRLNGLSMPNFSSDLEENLRSMFKQIQTPFLKHSPPKRKNFLSYSYVLHKFLQLLEKDEYLHFFPLLKSRDKLSSQDAIWKLICEEVGWQYIPSI